MGGAYDWSRGDGRDLSGHVLGSVAMGLTAGFGLMFGKVIERICNCVQNNTDMVSLPDDPVKGSGDCLTKTRRTDEPT